MSATLIEGLRLRNACAWAGAAQAFEAAVAADPTDLAARFERGCIRLLHGRLREGWPDFLVADPTHKAMAPFRRPAWNGAPSRDGTVLLLTDSGLGDAIMFARYVPMVAARARVVMGGPIALARLFGSLDGLSAYASDHPLPRFDRYCALSRLPSLFGTELGSIPAVIPYLSADAAEIAQWRARLAPFAGLKVGIVWAGNPKYPIDADRSIPAAAFATIARSPGVTLVSLQKGRPAEDCARVPGLLDWAGELRDLAATAALIMALDLVISVDTAVAHLAGALGRPVWLLNRASSDWRWLLDRHDSPWYPTMRIFRQPAPGDWATPLAAVAQSLGDVQIARSRETAG